MSLFWKVFITVYISFAIVAFFIFYVITVYEISYQVENIVDENKIIGSFISKEVEVGYLESRWPFESLKKLTEREDFLFWWVVRNDGTIHLADKTSFMGTQAYDYFPQAADAIGNGGLFLSQNREYGIFSKPLETGREKFSFWLGFSFGKVPEIRKKIILLAVLFSVSASVVFGIILYYTVRRFTAPVRALAQGAATIGEGNLGHRVEVRSRDELGQLANSFNKMAGSIQKTTVSKDYMDNIIGSMIDSLIVVDPDSKIRMMNKAACDLLGYTEEELIGKPVEPIFSIPEETPLRGEKLIKLIEEGGLNNYETYYRAKNGQEIPILLSCSAMKSKDGSVICIVCTGRDITSRKQAEEELKQRLEVEERITGELGEKTEELYQSNKELNTLIYTIAHDLKSPAVSLQGFSSLLMQEYEDRLDENGRMYLDRIQANSERMGNLMERLLQLFRIGRVKGQEGLVDISNLLNNVIHEFKSKPEADNIRVIVKDGMPTIRCDLSMMGNVFANLISNAGKYMGENNMDPAIEIGYADCDSYHRFYVRDNGIGIEEKYHDKIFQILQRLNDIKTEGTGVGLTIVKKTVESFGGEIWVDSAKGRGTTMYFTMPKDKGGLTDEDDRHTIS